MTKTSSFAVVLVAAVALMLPGPSFGQASRRGGDSGGGSSSGGSDSGSTAGPRSGPGTGGTAQPRASAPSAAPESQPAPRIEPAASRPAVARTISRETTTQPQPQAIRSGVVRRSAATSGIVTDTSTARVRGSSPVRGYAQARQYPVGGDGYWGGSGNWSSGYGAYYGGYYGGYYGSYYGHYGYYNGYYPWGYYGWYPGPHYHWGISFGYPYVYYPYGYYAPYGMSYPYYWDADSGGGGGESRDATPRQAAAATGSVRLKVNPKQARVYVDGALAGTAEEFGGLSDHLKLTSGPHELELRADGYQTYMGRIQVKQDRTSTERISLKKD